MKKYLADLLTFTRIILAIILIVIAVLPNDSKDIHAIAFCLFVIGELTDAFDGTCAERYPFPKNKIPKYRKYAAVYDMFADVLLAGGLALFFINHINMPLGLSVGVGFSVLAIVMDLIIYGKVFGHPDTCTKNSLMKKNFNLSKKLILTRRNLYLALIFTGTTITLYESSWPLAVKITITIIACIICLGLWIFLAQRRHNISRDAVDIEKELSNQKSAKKPAKKSTKKSA